ncbi:MAG: hypothetical protein MR449_08400, partial [Spirochaetia bacterium]|nr:hypothetical protein [Spirochaetia bacterium]
VLAKQLQLIPAKLYVSFHSSFLVPAAKLKARTSLQTTSRKAYTSSQEQAPPHQDKIKAKSVEQNNVIG